MEGIRNPVDRAMLAWLDTKAGTAGRIILPPALPRPVPEPLSAALDVVFAGTRQDNFRAIGIRHCQNITAEASELTPRGCDFRANQLAPWASRAGLLELMPTISSAFWFARFGKRIARDPDALARFEVAILWVVVGVLIRQINRQRRAFGREPI